MIFWFKGFQRVFWLFLAAFWISTSFLLAQEPLDNDLYQILPVDTLFVPLDTVSAGLIKLPHVFLIENSERLHVGSFPLRKRLHYRIDENSGTINLLRRFQERDTLRVIFRIYPFPLRKDYFHRELVTVAQTDSSDSLNADIARARRPGFLQDIDDYQYQLRKSGSILRGVEIGTNQDLALNSGLNLQLSGKISENVELIAALTDESTPIQPEGNTQTLREVDKVFVSITSPYISGTVGDFNLVRQQSAFGNLQRKLQGVTMESKISTTQQRLTFGSSRGSFHNNRFLAQEGNQGPYQLTGRNGEREIIVLAGTERIYVDGELLIRGENNDYTIDYSLAQITFSSNRLITSENRIEVDFEYSSAFQRYARNFLGAGSAAELLTGRLSYDVRAFREWDDTNNLLEDNAPLTDAEESALATAGDDPLAAAVTGVRPTDSTAGFFGDYDAQIIDPGSGDSLTIYVYVGRGQGDFRIIFSGVGTGNGDYRRTRLGVYEFVGKGLGNYLPVRLVPLAGDRRLLDAGVTLRASDALLVKGEFAVSEADRNVFSSIDDADNQGNALELSSSFRDSSLHFAGSRLGALQVNTQWRRQEENFEPLDRLVQPEYAYRWNLDQTNVSNQENSLQIDARYAPFKFAELSGEFGDIDKGSGITSTRRKGGLLLRRARMGESRMSLEQIDSKSGLDESRWQRSEFGLSRLYGLIRPAYRFKREDRQRRQDSLTGFTYDEHQATLSTNALYGVGWEASFENRQDFLYDPVARGLMLEQATTRTWKLGGEIRREGPLRGNFAFSFRDKDFTPFFEGLPADSIVKFQPDPQFQDTSWQDRQSHLANIELQYRNESGSINSRFDYKVASELQGIREKIYLKVDNNRGNFVFDSTLNEYLPDPQGDFILVLLQTGDFESVTRLEAGWQLQYRPEIRKSSSGDQSAPFLKRFSGLFYSRVEEESKISDIVDLYLLNLSQFHNLENSLRGSYILNQDIYFDERNPDWGFLLRSRYRDILSNQFFEAGDNETRILWERTMQARQRFFRRQLNVTLEYQNTLNKRWVASSPARNRNILSQSVQAKLNYRPDIRWQFQTEITRGFERERNSSNFLRVNFWDIKPQIAFALRGKSRTTARLTYLRVAETENPFDRPIPFEMGRGKKLGNSWQWDIRFEYFVSGNVTVNASYNGRRDAQALRTLHTGKAEVRVFF